MKYLTRILFFIALINIDLNTAFAQSTIPVDSFKVKGFHIDMRVQVMKMPALKKLAYDLSKQGINTLLVEWEGTYPFEKEPLIANRYAYTRAEIIDFVRYCKSLHIDVIPLQQSFGHVEYILRNNKYAALREDDKDFSQVCPSEPELNKKLFTELYKDLISTHNSPYIHIGGDETFLLGHCEKCKKRAAEIGLSKLYFDHIKMLCDIVVSLGKRPIIWADIALKYPQYITMLPKQTIFIDWNYGWDVNRFGNHDQLLKSGYEIWGAPSIRSDPDNYYLTCWQKHFENTRNFVPLCRQLGYKGIIMTSWSTSGAYSSTFDSSNELINLYAVRHVYPLTGFNILIQAYLTSLTTTSPLNINAFITKYCHEHYGFDTQEAGLFKKALFAAPYTIVNGKVMSNDSLTINQLLDSAVYSAKVLNELKPKNNIEQFDNYRLMAAIRVYYLSYWKIADAVNAIGFSRKNIAKYKMQLKALMSEEKGLNNKFNKLNGDLLYNTELSEENEIRNKRVHLLYDKLASIK